MRRDIMRAEAYRKPFFTSPQTRSRDKGPTERSPHRIELPGTHPTNTLPPTRPHILPFSLPLMPEYNDSMKGLRHSWGQSPPGLIILALMSQTFLDPIGQRSKVSPAGFKSLCRLLKQQASSPNNLGDSTSKSELLADLVSVEDPLLGLLSSWGSKGERPPETSSVKTLSPQDLSGLQVSISWKPYTEARGSI